MFQILEDLESFVSITTQLFEINVSRFEQSLKITDFRLNKEEIENRKLMMK